MTPQKEPSHKEGLLISKRVFFFRIPTPRREPGHKEGFFYLKTVCFLRILTPRREPVVTKEGF